MPNLSDAEKELSAQLNYGGITRCPDTDRLIVEWRQGDLGPEIDQMRRLSSAFQKLANALEGEGIECSVALPTSDDADDKGFVEWLRSGVWMRGLVAGDPPVDATRWRPTLLAARTTHLK